MENLFSLFLIVFLILGWYFFIKECLYTKLYKDIKINDINCKVIIKNKENDIEVLARKILYINDKYNIFNQIEFIDNNSIDDTYEILKRISEKHNNIKVRKIL